MASRHWEKAAAVVFLWCGTASAQDTPRPVQDVPPGEDRIYYLKEGEKAPFAGQLFDNPTAIRWGNWLEQYRYRLSFDVETQRQIDQVKIDYLSAVVSLEREKYSQVTDEQRKVIQDLQAQLAEPAPWYESFEFGMGVGVATTALVFGLSVLAVSQVNL